MNKKIIQDFFQFLNGSKWEEAFALLHEDMNWWILGNIPVSGNYDKRKISLGLKIIFRSFENFHFKLFEITAEEDRVSVIVESFGKRKTTQKDYNNHYHFLFTIKDGKIYRVKEYFDTIHAKWIEE